MGLPATIISGASLKTRWSMTDKDIVLMIINHELRIMFRCGAMFPYEPRTPDESMIGVTGYGSDDFPRKNIDVSKYQFSLEDVRRIEVEHQDSFVDRPGVLTIDQLIKRWEKDIEDPLDTLNTAGIMPVDPIGSYFDQDDLIHYMDAQQYIDESYLMYREDEIANLEARFLDAVLSQEPNPLPEPLIKLMKEAKPELEYLYGKIKDKGFTANIVDPEKTYMKAALNAFRVNPGRFKFTTEDMLSEASLYTFSGGKEKRDFVSRLLSKIIKKQDLPPSGGQNLYPHYTKLTD